ncbi:type II toxin-antitoxin system RelE family toxin [Methanosarcina sp.]|uniref:type II toxin-antitoxin system RelE family toxin n=1 Tax=Methanosarcina sp. TaxID=2213 RepID=UPI0029887E36|nr:type II toxin-antitoxin system RelE/ParE family toxin [Methanosarcina sp.]
MKFFWRRLQRILSKLDSKNSQRIIKAIEKLAEDPVPHDAKRIHSTSKKLFRIRVGNLRSLYRNDNEEIIIIIVNIGSRKCVY